MSTLYYETKPDELTHYGVPGMKWGRRKNRYGFGTSGFAPVKPKGQRPDYLPEKSDRQKQWEDDHGFNPHRPNGTKPHGISRHYDKITRKTLEKEYGDLENQMTYGKKANHKKNEQLQKKMSAIEKKLDKLSKQELAEKAKKAKAILSKLLSSASFIGTAYGTKRMGYDMGTSMAVGALAKQKTKNRQKLYEEYYK